MERPLPKSRQERRSNPFSSIRMLAIPAMEWRNTVMAESVITAASKDQPLTLFSSIRYPRRMRVVLALLSLLVAAAPGTPADLPNTARITLSERHVAALKQALKNEPAAAAAFAPVQKIADRALSEAPQPVKKIVSEGRLHNDPERIRS